MDQDSERTEHHMGNHVTSGPSRPSAGDSDMYTVWMCAKARQASKLKHRLTQHHTHRTCWSRSLEGMPYSWRHWWRLAEHRAYQCAAAARGRAQIRSAVQSSSRLLCPTSLQRVACALHGRVGLSVSGPVRSAIQHYTSASSLWRRGPPMRLHAHAPAELEYVPGVHAEQLAALVAPGTECRKQAWLSGHQRTGQTASLREAKLCSVMVLHIPS